MEVTEFTIKILLLFMPGLIITFLDDKNTNKVEKEAIIFLLRSFLYGAFTYFVLSGIYGLINCIINCISDNFIIAENKVVVNLEVHFFKLLNNEEKNIDFIETFIVSAVAILIAAVKSSWHNIVKENNHLMTKNPESKFEKFVLIIENIFKKLKITRDDIGNSDVWDYLFTGIGQIVTVKDWDNSIFYIGTLVLNSESHDNAELYLEDVLIGNMKEPDNVREVDAVYLCKDKASSWDIEIDA